MMRPIEPEQSAGHGRRTKFIKALISKRTITLPADLEMWGVQSKNRAPIDGQIDDQLTAAEYATLQDAFNFLNHALFSDDLPQAFITLQRHPTARGYFSAKRFQDRRNRTTRVHEIALNPDAFGDATDKQILGTLAHEMVHLQQEEFGNPGRGRYHNREFALKMHSIGLMPSSTGQPGGAVTGDRVTHYVLPGGAFDIASDLFLSRYALKWQSALLEPVANSAPATPGSDATESDTPPADGEPEGAQPKRQTRVKYTCPICGLNVWAKPGALIDCHSCSEETGEQILLVPTESTKRTLVPTD